MIYVNINIFNKNIYYYYMNNLTEKNLTQFCLNKKINI